nr:unnamed protein product [Callosobruchus analis]CAI5864430.1 unnamed protein product [Callosobruchus analis]
MSNFRIFFLPKTFKYLVNFNLRRNIVTLSNSNIQPLSCENNLYNLNINRYKSKANRGKLNKKDSETENSEDISDDFISHVQDKHTKTLKVDVASLRFDSILKAGLGLSRNKIETMFYESRLRLNGEKVLKKSVAVQENDEVDIIKGFSISNPDHLIVARVEVLSVKAVPEEEKISVKLRRCKNLVIENYPGRNKWDG